MNWATYNWWGEPGEPPSIIPESFTKQQLWDFIPGWYNPSGIWWISPRIVMGYVNYEGIWYKHIYKQQLWNIFAVITYIYINISVYVYIYMYVYIYISTSWGNIYQPHPGIARIDSLLLSVFAKFDGGSVYYCMLTSLFCLLSRVGHESHICGVYRCQLQLVHHVPLIPCLPFREAWVDRLTRHRSQEETRSWPVELHQDLE